MTAALFRRLPPTSPMLRCKFDFKEKVFAMWIRIMGGLLDPDPRGQMPILIQEVKHTEIKLKMAMKRKKNLKIKMQLI